MTSTIQFTRRGRTLLPGQVSQLTTIASDGSGRKILFEADEIIEAASVMTPDRTARFFSAFASLADQFYRMMPPPAPRPAGARGPQSTPLAYTPARAPDAQPAPPRPPMPPFLCREGQ